MSSATICRTSYVLGFYVLVCVWGGGEGASVCGGGDHDTIQLMTIYALPSLQDDTYTDSYISTIGVDFVSFSVMSGCQSLITYVPTVVVSFRHMLTRFNSLSLSCHC